ncbi:2TM domain-containing protein [Vibrio mangrovi]|uniref:2TM domain-containing protein n=1 Tax=Vibrio mangrovi TaxID=474394 RepID=A0A1Y6IQS8_9VIBR|nr:2TM domain-containing protein [Vibrio mangrovi]MDW6003234.1 2TM domain-containing protein [Vibrio mangrovi]SMR99978.1 DNA-binding transcriptional repressor PuuR [Vibrio mangrovi]
MNIRKRRLQKGWSQEQLAQLSGLNIRTIQRIERDQKPSLESLNALAAVFEIELSELQGEQDMHKTSQISEEERAISYVRDIKGFYSHAITYCLVITLLFIINFSVNSDYIWAWWPMLGWGIGLISHGLNVFEVFNLFGPNWERKQIEKRLGRKL